MPHPHPRAHAGRPAAAAALVALLPAGGVLAQEGGAADGPVAHQPAAGQPPAAPDKSGYHLFNPTPRSLRRPLSADRPDITESPFTVDAGAVQLEVSFVEFTKERVDGERVDRLLVAPHIIKLGVLNDADVQLAFEPYVREDPRGGSAVDGLGDLTLRMKYNLWGNDGGRTALGLLPFITFPTAEDDLATRRPAGNRVTGGVAVPFQVELAEGWGLGLMAQLDFFRDEAAGKDVTELLHTAALQFPIAEDLGGFLEYAGTEPLHGGGSYRALLGTGVVWELSANIHMDVAVRFGLTRGDGEDFTVLAGFTIRF